MSPFSNSKSYNSNKRIIKNLSNKINHNYNSLKTKSSNNYNKVIYKYNNKIYNYKQDILVNKFNNFFKKNHNWLSREKITTISKMNLKNS